MKRTAKTKEALKQWAKALKSGRYRQTTEVLSDHGAFCCLGLACKLEDPKRTKWSDFEGNMPHYFREKYGLSKADNNLFVSLNDEGLLPFKEIARVVESPKLMEQARLAVRRSKRTSRDNFDDREVRLRKELKAIGLIPKKM